jgi:hypothetical protein
MNICNNTTSIKNMTSTSSNTINTNNSMNTCNQKEKVTKFLQNRQCVTLHRQKKLNQSLLHFKYLDSLILVIIKCKRLRWIIISLDSLSLNDHMVFHYKISSPTLTKNPRNFHNIKIPTQSHIHEIFQLQPKIQNGTLLKSFIKVPTRVPIPLT